MKSDCVTTAEMPRPAQGSSWAQDCATPQAPLTIEGQVRSLVAHEDSDYEEWGMSGAIRVTPSPSGRGLTLAISPAWGRTGSAADRLWSAHDARALGADSEFEADSQIAIDAGYGVGLPGNRGVLTPYTGMTLGDAGTRTVRAGTGAACSRPTPA